MTSSSKFRGWIFSNPAALQGDCNAINNHCIKHNVQLHVKINNSSANHMVALHWVKLCSFWSAKWWRTGMKKDLKHIMNVWQLLMMLSRFYRLLMHSDFDQPPFIALVWGHRYWYQMITVEPKKWQIKSLVTTKATRIGDPVTICNFKVWHAVALNTFLGTSN